jgi:hypothetical protein
MIFYARATRGLRRPSLDARSGRSISPHPWEITSELESRILLFMVVVVRCAQGDQINHTILL